MSTFSPEKMKEIIQQMEQEGVSYAKKAEELGVPCSTLYTAARRFKKKKPAPKAANNVVQVVDVKKPKSMTMLDRLSIIETQLHALRETLRSIQ